MRNWYWWTWVILLTLTAGCVSWWPKFVSPEAPKAPKKSEKHYNWDEKVESKPKVIVSEKDGKVTVFNEETKTLHVTHDDSETETPLTWWQRTCRWLGNLGTIGVILIVIGLFVAPGATVGFVFRAFRRTRTALRQTVKAVKESGAVDKENGLYHALDRETNETTKDLIARIKAKL